MQNKGIAHLDSIIAELESGSIQTTAISLDVETR